MNDQCRFCFRPAAYRLKLHITFLLCESCNQRSTEKTEVIEKEVTIAQGKESFAEGKEK
jgi:hypothetical protein